MKKELMAEFFGSMLLVAGTVGSMFKLYTVMDMHVGIALIGCALATGFILFGLIETFGPISGAHFNPLVTSIMICEGKISVSKSFKYIISQLIGGFVGIKIVHLMFLEYIDEAFFISENVRDGNRFFSEIVSSFILIFTILVLIRKKSTNTPLVIGLMVAGQIMATSSGFFANPMVTFSRIFTSVISGIRPADAFMVIIMQFVGGFLAYGTYRYMFKGEEITNG